jgi:hypothetical protein
MVRSRRDAVNARDEAVERIGRATRWIGTTAAAGALIAAAGFAHLIPTQWPHENTGDGTSTSSNTGTNTGTGDGTGSSGTGGSGTNGGSGTTNQNQSGTSSGGSGSSGTSGSSGASQGSGGSSSSGSGLQPPTSPPANNSGPSQVTSGGS